MGKSLSFPRPTSQVLAVRIKKTQEEEAIATVDGGASAKLRAGDYIKVRRAGCMVKLVRLSGRSFYQVLRAKLNGV